MTDCYRVKVETPIVHAAAIKARGDWIQVAWPQDGLQHAKGSGETLAKQYRDQGVAMLDRMKTGRLKVAAHLNDWWEEFRLYHRKNGLIVKEADDLMSATRYALMMLRSAIVKLRSKPIKYPKGSYV
jgi:hypothetical protein